MKLGFPSFFSTVLFFLLLSFSAAKHNTPLSRRSSKRQLRSRAEPESQAFDATSRSVHSDHSADSQLEKRDGTKYVFMHHIVGNTYEYTRDSWLNDFDQIRAKDIDAVALNIGRDTWQSARVQDAYSAAAMVGMSVFVSFDYTSFDCNIETTVNWVNAYKGLPGQFKIDGRPMISSYSGDCLGPDGWQTIRDQTGGFLMPFIYGDDDQQLKKGSSYGFFDSWYCWGCAWPQGNYNKTTDDDHYYMNILESRYATTISPWMFTHYDNKNFYLRGDDWLLITRWEQLISMRDQLTFVEMVTWNDYGESDYFGTGPSSANSQPSGTTWTDGFPHNGFFDLSAYYITYFKTGVYPRITKDTVYFWLRPHPASINAKNDPLPKPEGWDWTSDTLWAAAFCSSTCNVTLRVGSYSQDFDNLPYGVNKISLPLKALGNVTVKMSKNGQEVINHTPSDFQYQEYTDHYNYNAYVGSVTTTLS
ncbi:glycosyl hydrolase family 71-domain-containing protein [Lentinula guzmanii]|uniref:Glycosyl hydrolase family 71-domain-containing protein n=1 Tax=Lentinula guzmanii TaxID=2804957 RepID=A0AA38N088_9AGAR|nr:glycosyl hydrolase family 71-domain-containing protein [Lentinula guzmanii]